MFDSIVPLIGLCVAVIGVFGWSHSALRSKLDMLSDELRQKTSAEDVRQILEDKLEVSKVQYQEFTRRIDELKTENHILSEKIDQIIELLIKKR